MLRGTKYVSKEHFWYVVVQMGARVLDWFCWTKI